jgi:hypothetical protein
MSSSEQTVKAKQEDYRPQKTNTKEEENFEEVDLAFSEQELTRKNSFDFIIAEKKNDDEIHDLLHGKAKAPKLAVPPPALTDARGEVRRYGETRCSPVERIEMTDFSRERDLEAGLVPKTPVKKQDPASNCISM